MLGSDLVLSHPTLFVGKQEFADMIRLLRLLVAQAEAAGSAGMTPRADSAPLRIARRRMGASSEVRASTRTALRDLVSRVDSERPVLTARFAEPARAEALSLPVAADIHLFPTQEP